MSSRSQSGHCVTRNWSDSHFGLFLPRIAAWILIGLEAWLTSEAVCTGNGGRGGTKRINVRAGYRTPVARDFLQKKPGKLFRLTSHVRYPGIEPFMLW